MSCSRAPRRSPLMTRPAVSTRSTTIRRWRGICCRAVGCRLPRRSGRPGWCSRSHLAAATRPTPNSTISDGCPAGRWTSVSTSPPPTGLRPTTASWSVSSTTPTPISGGRSPSRPPVTSSSTGRRTGRSAASWPLRSRCPGGRMPHATTCGSRSPRPVRSSSSRRPPTGSHGTRSGPPSPAPRPRCTRRPLTSASATRPARRWSGPCSRSRCSTGSTVTCSSIRGSRTANSSPPTPVPASMVSGEHGRSARQRPSRPGCRRCSAGSSKDGPSPDAPSRRHRSR